MPDYFPGLKGIKDIWLEFVPALQTAVSNKAVLFVQMVHTTVFAQIPPSVAASIPHLEELRRGVDFFLQYYRQVEVANG